MVTGDSSDDAQHMMAPFYAVDTTTKAEKWNW